MNARELETRNYFKHLARRLPVVRCTILKYVGRVPAAGVHEGSAGVSADVFRAHLQFLIEHRFQIVGLDLVAKAFAGSARLPERSIVITFEGDGSFSDAVGNQLIANQLPAVVYVDPHSANPQGLRRRIGQMRELGITIGHQIVIERFANDMLPIPTEEQVRGTKHELELLSGSPIDHATYAYDVFLGTERKILGRLGYKTAATVATAMGGLHIDPFSIRQSAISEQDDIGRFGWKLWRSGAKPGVTRGSTLAPLAQTAGV